MCGVDFITSVLSPTHIHPYTSLGRARGKRCMSLCIAPTVVGVYVCCFFFQATTTLSRKNCPE